MLKSCGAVLALLVVAGCGQGEKPTAEPTPAPAAAVNTDKVLALTGPGGTVALGDSVEAAKKAFPAPTGAKQSDTSMTYVMLTKKGWAWLTEQGPESFEAATIDGKIVALGRGVGPSGGGPAATIAELGEPTRKGGGRIAEIYVWESGDNARYLVDMLEQIEAIPFKTMMFIGKKEDLKKMNYDADDPGKFDKQLEATLDSITPPSMKTGT